MNFNKIPSKERAFSEVYGGYYDEHGFYNSPNGSFWDPDGYYFNRYGFDINGKKGLKLGGSYDDKGNYIEPGLFDDYHDDEDEFYNEEEYKKFQVEENYLDDGYDDEFDEEELFRHVEIKKDENLVESKIQEKKIVEVIKNEPKFQEKKTVEAIKNEPKLQEKRTVEAIKNEPKLQEKRTVEAIKNEPKLQEITKTVQAPPQNSLKAIFANKKLIANNTNNFKK